MATTKVNNPEEAVTPRSKIVSMLNEHRIPWKSWGIPGSKSRSLNDLFEYHEEDRLYFRNGTNGSSDKLIIDVHVGVVLVMHQFEGKWYELYEDRQEFPDGAVLMRDNFDGIGETAQRTEATMEETAIRCLEEELKFTDPTKYEMTECLKVEHREPAQSEKWPGIMASYHRYKFECEISSSIFRPEGYVEEDESRLVYFKWRLLRQPEFRF